MLSIESNQSPEPPDDFQFIQYFRPIIEIRLLQIGHDSASELVCI